MRLFKENGVEKVAATMRDPDPAIVVLKTDGTEVCIINKNRQGLYLDCPLAERFFFSLKMLKKCAKWVKI